jgi:hypothetical protein
MAAKNYETIFNDIYSYGQSFKERTSEDSQKLVNDRRDLVRELADILDDNNETSKFLAAFFDDNLSRFSGDKYEHIIEPTAEEINELDLSVDAKQKIMGYFEDRDRNSNTHSEPNYNLEGSGYKKKNRTAKAKKSRKSKSHRKSKSQRKTKSKRKL